MFMKFKYAKGMKMALALTVAISTLVLPTTSQVSAQSKPVATQSSAKTETMPKAFNDISLGLRISAKGKKTYNTEFNKIIKNAKKKKTTLDKIYYVHNEVSMVTEAVPPLESGQLEIRSTAYGALVDHKADPHGYTHLMYLLLNKLNIENEVINANPYAWNLVKMGKNYYHVDTFMDNYQGFEHGYFMLSDKQRKKALPVKWKSKHKATDTKYDFFANTYENLAFTDKGIYGASNEKGVPMIHFTSLTGKKSITYKSKGNEIAIARYGGWYFLLEEVAQKEQKVKAEGFTKKPSTIKQTSKRLVRVRYDGKKKETLYEGKALGVILAENKIIIQGDPKGKIEIDILKLKY